MHKYTLPIAGIVLGTTLGQTASAISLTPPPLQPVILTVAVNPAKNALILTGNNFGNTLPSVYLSGEALQVKSFSSNQVMADLPSNLPAAFYRLTLVNGTDRSKHDHFTLELSPSASDFAHSSTSE